MLRARDRDRDDAECLNVYTMYYVLSAGRAAARGTPAAHMIEKQDSMTMC